MSAPRRADTQAGRALVTGASRGIGKAIAEALVREGWEVTGTCRSPRRLAARDRIEGVRYLALDLAKEKDAAAVARAAGEIDLLVNNAGESPIGPAEEMPVRKMRQHFDINFFGPVALLQGILPGMRKRRRGLVIFIGSIRGEAPSPFSSIYSASKAATRAFTECLRLELMGTGVKAAVVVPWYVRTSLPQERFIAKKSPYARALESVSKARERTIANAPDPSVVADVVLRLARSRDPAPVTIVGRPLATFFARHAPRKLVGQASARYTGMRPL
ncbi:MAG TPA: SDR family NAD(P)-dependent oxidoreductase [Spirochaetia bacterium]|nr:SDR family NAD(P)-dependent oxidoreductase [Spirochaetia bacterium]